MKKMVLKIIVATMVVFGYSYATQNSPIITGKYEATGYSAANQSRFAARIAAKVDAQRQLLEQIKGTKIDSETTVEDGMMKSDVVVTKINGVLKNAKIVNETYDSSSGTASVTLAIGFNEIAAQILSDKNLIKEIEKDNPPQKTEHKQEAQKIEKITNQVVYDGLIIDTRGLNMEPAMINRVFNGEEMVYDPTKVPQTVVVERGLAAYTIDINKAKAILETYGSKNPFIIKALALGSKKSDVKIAKKDAKILLDSDKKNGFLSAAKVVFVLDN